MTDGSTTAANAIDHGRIRNEGASFRRDVPSPSRSCPLCKIAMRWPCHTVRSSLDAEPPDSRNEQCRSLGLTCN